MTYHTPVGDRTVRGAEAELVREALFWTVHYVTMIEGADEEFSLKSFDLLSYGQQLVGLLTIARALFDDKVPAPPLTASIEACTAILFQTLMEEIECEIDEDGVEGREKKNIRRAIRATLAEMEADELPDIECTDARVWQNEIEIISEGFLFDRDFEDADDYTDLPPDQAQARYKEMNIDPEYFLHVLDDPPEPEWLAMEKELRNLADEGARL